MLPKILSVFKWQLRSDGEGKRSDPLGGLSIPDHNTREQKLTVHLQRNEWQT